MNDPTTPSIAAVARRLDERAAQLEREVAAAQARGAADEAGAPREVVDREEEADRRRAEEVNSAEIERDLAELRDIALARQRIAGGGYGLCADCGAPIDPARLLAQPTALRCIACQTAAERRRPRG